MTFLDPFFYLYFCAFLLSIFFAFFVVGDVLLYRLNLKGISRIALASTVGMILWSLQGMLVGYLQLRQLTYLYIFLFFLFWLYLYGRTFVKDFFVKKDYSFDLITGAIIFLGVCIQMIMVFYIGVYDSQGLSVCCFWPDDLYHLALTHELVTTFPPQEPGMAGVVVHNYHYLANIGIAELIRVFHLPLLDTQYRYIPFVISTLLGLVALAFAEVSNLSRTFQRWFVFFLFFSGDIYFLLPFVLGQGIHINETLPERATTLWFSPPRFFALVIAIALFSFLYLWIKKKSTNLGIIVALLSATLIGFKIYIAVIALVAFGIIAVYKLIKKDFTVIIPGIILVLLLGFLYLPINAGAGGLFFVGFWRFENFVIRPEIGLIRYEVARQIYFNAHNYIRVVFVESLFMALYTIAFFGLFLLGVIQTRQSVKALPLLFHIAMLFGIIVSLIAGYFFLQTTGGANTVQFLFNGYIIGSLYLALFCTHWLSKLPKKLFVPCLVLFCVLASFRVVYEGATTFQKILSRKDYLTISYEQLEAIQKVNEIVPKDKIIALPLDTATQDTCYYHAFLLQAKLFLCGNGILNDHGVDTKKRVETLSDMASAKDFFMQESIAHSAHIDYLLIPSSSNQKGEGKVIYKNAAYTLISYE